MKNKLYTIIFIILVIATLFGWRYYYLPSVVMARRSPVSQKLLSKNAIEMPRVIPKVIKKPTLIKDGAFKEKYKYWRLWSSARTFTNSIKFIKIKSGKYNNAVRIENPMKKLVGIQQRVRVVSNAVYKLSGIARSLGNEKSKIFGGRIAFWLPPQKEKQIVWMSEYNQWWRKELIFTNQVTGTATVYVHMGYGGVASTGEFTNIRLELINAK